MSIAKAGDLENNLYHFGINSTTTTTTTEDTKLSRILPVNEFIQKENLKKECNSQKIGLWVSKCR